MTHTRLRVFAVTALLTVAIAVLGNGEDKSLKEISDYRQWTRLTEKPLPVENSFAGGG